MTLRRALLWSFWLHAFFAFLLWLVDFRALRIQEKTAQHEAIRRHEAGYQRKASATYADRLKRMRELIERLDREQRQKENAPAPQPNEKTATEKPPAPIPEPPKPKPSEKPKNEIEQLWQESRKNHEAMRERYEEQKARALAELTKTDLETARKEVQADSKDPLNGRQSAPGGAGEAAADIAKMHADGQRMLNETLQHSRHKTEGQSLDQESAREVYLLGQNNPGAPETQRFDEVVDYTPLMVSRGPRVNSILDTPEDLRRIEKLRSPILQRHFNQTRGQIQFTRRIGDAGANPATWVAPDAWYIIGPFPNHWRSQIETSFPPELEIDREAIYEGRDGRPLSWEYVRSRNIGVRPPDMEDFGVYYAYTEINCAMPIDCWLAIGSDDYSKLWVNGLLVWSGAKNEKIWNPTEGFRRVHFEQGVNRLLLRLENGINACEFSVLIALE